MPSEHERMALRACAPFLDFSPMAKFASVETSPYFLIAKLKKLFALGMVHGEAKGNMNVLTKIPTLAALYGRWEREHWNVNALDFTDDRRHWLRLTDQERWQWYSLAGLSHFGSVEPHAVSSLALLLTGLPRPEQRNVLATQIADEGRHAFFSSNSIRR